MNALIYVSPSILHFITHDFFCPAAYSSDNLESNDNPLIYSGLAFSGCNRLINDYSRKYSGDSELDDGLLTAFEVSGMNLHGSELVILQACRTGKGTVLNGEGVFGLRRSFIHAGVNSIIMSMWDIPDKQSAYLLTAFYDKLLRGDNISDALRDSALKLLHEGRQEGLGYHPMFWGGFILSGNPN
ncbi:MAG: CHAT domain-containing protein [candidate division Zixibacteria bacterium]|nr:CHAT domain-containing protein [candidate division Zixibacteria bacterium]